MKTDRWKNVKALFLVARELGPDELRGYLSGLDESLSREVESLLASDEKDSFIEPPRFGSVARLLEDDDDVPTPQGPLRGTKVGPYRVIRRLGEGGMGEVYLGERADGSFAKQVAIKVVRTEHASDVLRKRFVRERETLASFEHPHVARLIDGGTLEDGRPYLVMEFVDGRPIDRFCDEERLDNRARIQLFRQVLEAVRYAHSRLVVHRDLKPGNILVDSCGQVKLLDFGIAKILQGSSKAEACLTEEWGSCPLTLEYASPEQIRGELITTSTDIYSLGVVLYRLLTGQNPYQLNRGLRREVERVICEDDPVKPSTAARKARTRTSPKSPRESEADTAEVATLPTSRSVCADLDSIVLMALRKSPRDRYGSADQLEHDLQRWLDGLPVKSRHSTWSYRVRRFVRRHRIPVVLLSTLSVTVLAGLVALGREARIVTQERDRALRAQQKLEEVNNFLVRMLQSGDPFRDGGALTVAELLEQAGTALEENLIEDGEVRATLHTTLGQTYYRLGKYEESRRQHRHALTLRESYRPRDPQTIGWSLSNLGILYYRQAQFDLAVDYFEQARTVFLEAEPTDHKDLAQVLNNLASSYSARGEVDRAISLSEQALSIRKRVLGVDSLEVAESLNNLANYARLQKDWATAQQRLRRTLEIRERHLDPDHPLLAQTLGNLGVLEANAGNYEEGRKLVERSLELQSRRLGEDHPDLAYPLTHLGQMARRSGDLKTAEPHLARAVALRKAAYAGGHRLTSHSACIWAACLFDLGRRDTAYQLLSSHYPAVAEWYTHGHEMCQEYLDMLIQLSSERNDEAAASRYQQWRDAD